MLYVKTKSRCDLLSEQTNIVSAPLSSNVGTLTVGDVYKRNRYVTLRVDLTLIISIVRWETELVRISEFFRPYVGIYTINCSFYIYHDTGIIKSAIILNQVRKLFSYIQFILQLDLNYIVRPNLSHHRYNTDYFYRSENTVIYKRRYRL